MTQQEMINEIALRANRLLEKYSGNGGNFLTFLMDITACHKANPLNLEKLLNFDNSNFMHDVMGINQHLDRETAELKDCFWPRCGSQPS